jgi:hypothetical protein
MTEFDAPINGKIWVSEILLFIPGISCGIRKTFASVSNARKLEFCSNAVI